MHLDIKKTTYDDIAYSATIAAGAAYISGSPIGILGGAAIGTAFAIARLFADIVIEKAGFNRKENPMGHILTSVAVFYATHKALNYGLGAAPGQIQTIGLVSLGIQLVIYIAKEVAKQASAFAAIHFDAPPLQQDRYYREF